MPAIDISQQQLRASACTRLLTDIWPTRDSKSLNQFLPASPYVARCVRAHAQFCDGEKNMKTNDNIMHQNPPCHQAQVFSEQGSELLHQLNLLDAIAPDPAPVVQPDDHPSTAQDALPVQQPTAAPADLSEQLVSTTEGPNATTAASMAPASATVPDKIPSGWSLRIKTGREAMQRRALRLYAAVATCAGLMPMEMRIVGTPILVDKVMLDAIHHAFVASDTRYQMEVSAAIKAGEPVDLRATNLAHDRARKTIVRAFGDLVSIYAADIIVDTESGGETGYRVHRLPEVYRRQIEAEAGSVYARPGGGRILVDNWGLNVGRQSPSRASD